MKKYHLWLIIIILIALALRLYNLTYHSLWFDEAVSVYWARQSVARILAVGFTLVEDRLPPLYYLTLKGWAALFGFSETSVRLLSVALGVLLVPVAASVAARLFKARIALLAALLVALNPFLIWYAQEARMYAPAVLFSTLTVWSFLQVCRGIDREPSLSPLTGSRLGFTMLFVLSAVAGLYSHLYTGFLLPALGLWLLISYPRAWRLWAWLAGCGLIITLLFAPLALAIWRFSAEAEPGTPWGGLLWRAWWLLRSFTIWKAPLGWPAGMILALLFGLFLLAAYLPRPGQLPASDSGRTGLRHPRLLLSLLLVGPFAIATLLLYRNYLAFFGERYFIVMVPWLLLLAAVGADTLYEWLRLKGPRLAYLPFGLLLIVTVSPIPGQWSIPASKEAWRQSVAYLAQQAAPEDAILIHPDWVRYPFQFYFRGPGQTYAAFSNVTADTPLDGPLQGVVDDHPVVWLIQSHLDGPDPEQRVEQWFAARYPLVTELYPPGITLKGYATRYRFEALPPGVTPVDIRFDNGLRLAGYQADPVAAARDRLFHPPSGWVHVSLYWQAPRPVTGQANPYLHLVGPEGVWGVNLDRPNDTLKLFPPAEWPPQTLVRQDMDVNLNPDTPPGRYRLVLGLPGTAREYPLSEVEIR